MLLKSEFKRLEMSITATVLMLLAVCLFFGTCTAQKPNLDGILNRRQDVYIAGFFPFGRGVDQSSLGRGVMPSVKLALDHVNEHTEVLKNYRLHMWWNDTECNAAVGVKSFFDMMHSGPNKLMLFGAACTHVTDPIAKASKHWHLTQLSYADTHPMFTKDSFPNFFRIVPSENAFNYPRLALLRHFNWTRVGTIYQNEPRYSLAHNRLVADLDTHGFEVVETQSFANEVRSALEKLKDKDVRVILGNFNESWAVQVFCEAYNLEMFGRSYQWLVMGTYSEEWWTKHEDMRLSCNESHVSTSLESAILTDLLPLSTSGTITTSGITADEYKMEYDSRRGMEYSRFHGYTYDGIWAVALAIQHVAQKLRHVRKNSSVVDFKYRDPMWEQLFLEALRNTSFEGVTGPVRFYDNERKASILLKQFQEGQEVKVGEYCSELSRLDFSSDSPMKWIGRYPPKDRTVHLIEHSQVNIMIYAVLACCSVVGIILATLFLVVNITYRNQRYIKMSSPHLNNLIIIGCMLTYLSVIFLGLDSGLSSIGAFPYICTARAWLLMAGFSLAFGAMFSKTWRVHSIFTDVKLNKKVIKDYQLFMVVGVLLAIDLGIMTTWQVSDPFYRETKQMDPYPHPSSEDVLIIRENEYCQSERMTIFLGVIYAYKGLLMIFGAFLAWETRHVSIPALNDSKHVGMSIYNVIIMCVMGAPIALVLADHKDAVFILISVFIIFCTTATLCLVFVPKLVELRRNKRSGSASGDGRMRATLRVGGPRGAGGAHSPPPAELERRLRDQKATNTRYRKQLQAKETELQMLIGKLGADAASIPTSGASSVPAKGAPQRLGVPALLAPKENASQPDTSEITSLCSLTASQGADEFYYLQQLSGERTKEVSIVSQSSQGETLPTEPIPIKKEPGATKNVSFKNHTDSSPSNTPGNRIHGDQNRTTTYEPPPKYSEPVANNQAVAGSRSHGYGEHGGRGYADQIPSNTFRGHAEVLSSNGARPVLEKDQLAKSPYGWRQEIEPVAPPPLVKQVSLQQGPTADYANQQARAHRRTSSIGQPALVADIMQQASLPPEPAPPPQPAPPAADVIPRPVSLQQNPDDFSDIEYADMNTMERKRLGQRRDSEKRRSNFVVAQSDLWDTNTFSYAPSKQPVHHHSPIQRSVSERNQRHSHSGGHPTPPPGQTPREPTAPSGFQSPKRKSSNASSHYGSGQELNNHHPVKEAAEVPPAPVQQQQQQQHTPAAARSGVRRQPSTDMTSNRTHQISGFGSKQPPPLQLFNQQAAGRTSSQPGGAGAQHRPRQAAQRPHHLSTPDVHNNKVRSGRGGRQCTDTAARLNAASSESELFECAILPIFQKLLSERQQGPDVRLGLSCPNISIKCDIVEYL